MQYSDDLRHKLIAAWQDGHGTQQELADVFGVSRGWVQKVLRRWRETGDANATARRHGPPPRTNTARLAALVAQRPDATLAELGRRLRVSAATVCRCLQRLGLPVKKRACTPASATRLVSSGCVRLGAKRAAVWTRAGWSSSTKPASTWR